MNLSFVKLHVAARITVPVAILVLVVALGLGILVGSVMSSRAEKHADELMDQLEGSIYALLTAVDEMSRAQTRSSMDLLRTTAGEWGAPRLGSPITLGAESVPALYIGGIRQTGRFELVDKVTRIAGGTATLFVRRGEDFVRVSTNVKKTDGTRAIGTLLDPKGKAIARIRDGEPFYGVVDILGQPYMTGYEPMRDRTGAVIGIWYVGYPLSQMNTLKKEIDETRILTNGFAALLDAKGSPIMRSGHTTPESVQKVLGSGAGEWEVRKTPFEAWGYTIVAAHPDSDLREASTAVQFSALGIALVVALLVTLIVAVVIRRMISVPLHAIVTQMQQADLSSTIASDRQDEVGRLTAAFNAFVASIRSTLLEVTQASTAVAGASTEISSSTEQMAAGSQEQTTQAGEVASAVEEMTKTIVENSRNASTTAEVAKQAQTAAESGAGVINSLQHVMERIVSSATTTGEMVNKLGTSSEQIGEIIQTIDDIADQTNLLALNAAIEAARAGEQGRGFAVVADEVRKLAERTTKATKEVASTIKGIQADTQAALGSMVTAKEVVAEGMARTQEGRTVMAQIVDLTNKAKDMVTQIAAASEEQSSASEQISKNVEGISAVTQETARGTTQIAHAAEDLNRQTENLKRLVEAFRLEAREQQATPRALRG